MSKPTRRDRREVNVIMLCAIVVCLLIVILVLSAVFASLPRVCAGGDCRCLDGHGVWFNAHGGIMHMNEAEYERWCVGEQ
jgi:hypothetical protein